MGALTINAGQLAVIQNMKNSIGSGVTVADVWQHKGARLELFAGRLFERQIRPWPLLPLAPFALRRCRGIRLCGAGGRQREQREVENGSVSKRMNLGSGLIEAACWVIAGVLVCGMQQTLADESSQRLSRETNQSSQRYEINQTFGGQAYRKDNNIWVYNKEFAELFGMPQQYIEDVQGVAAAAFRIEDTSFQECGFGGSADACRKVEECVLDLYFDETKKPLPWATDMQMQWYPSRSSMIWLRPLDVRSERPHGTLAVEPPSGIIRNKGRNSAFIPFADPASKVEASFTTNAFDANGDSETVSRGMYLLGYMRDFYRGLSVVSLQFSCETFSRKTINVRLDSRRSGIYEAPIARFNRVFLPERFVQRIKELQKTQSDRNAVFYRSLFAPPLGTKGSQTNNSADQ